MTVVRVKSIFILILIQLGFFIASNHALAWTSRGNGGNIVLCNGNVVGFYDRIEMETRHGWLLNLSGIPSAVSTLEDKSTPKRIAAEFLSRLKPLNHVLYSKLMNELDLFFEHTTFIVGYFPTPIPDRGTVFLPNADCMLEQLIVQKLRSPVPSMRYVISAEYWNQLSPLDQAVALIHEVIYFTFPDPETSEPVRLFTSLILSDRISEFSPKEFLEFMVSMHSGMEPPDFGERDRGNAQ